MAEAAVENGSSRFFCHKCYAEISPVLPDYTCPRCQSGFIEELDHSAAPQESEESEDEGDPAAQFAELWSANTFLDTLRRLDHEHSRGETSRGNQLDGSGPGDPSSSTTPSESTNPREMRGPHYRPNWRRVRSQNRQNIQHFRQPLEGIIHQIFSNLTGGTGFVSNTGFPVILNLHGNPGDYAWGRGGLDSIITQLLNQLDTTGPPPLSKEKISEIPTVHIQQDQVDHNLQCSVCMEDFKTGEAVKKLSCQHHYHNDCIIPWLELHGTCPICRKLLNEETTVGDSGLGTESSSSTPNTLQESSHFRESSNTSSTNSEHQNSSMYDFNEDLDFD
ncbi:E3 ubiquitin-protein ligase RNF115-like isoform X1 [Tachypleus tridentatus]|uniref:E3 ubiquitin-protein ligase RNF115-like isoform X1 n=1 Tax=Tachypleus tridentatus TaxID=6853 RepID=UPI003FCF8A32